MAFTYPPAPGGGATSLEGLTDVNVSDPTAGQFLVFDGTNWVAVTEPATTDHIIPATAPALFYKSRGAVGAISTGAYVESYLTPISFNRDMVVTKFAMRFNSIPNTGTMPNGEDVWFYAYTNLETSKGNRPNALLVNGGVVNFYNNGTPPNTANQTIAKTLASPVTLNAGEIYWIGASLGISNGSGGVTPGDAATYRQVGDGGSSDTANNGVGLGEIPYAHLGLSCYYAEDIAMAPVWGTAPATLDQNLLYPQPYAPLVWIEGEPA